MENLELTRLGLKKIEAKALEFLSRREHSSQELKRKLCAKGFSSELVQENLAKLQEKGYQSDERFAESYIRTRSQRGFGPIKIAAELREKGLSSKFIDLFLNRDNIDWIGIGKEILAKKFGGSAPRNVMELAKQNRFMQYKGFSGEQIKLIVRDNQNDT